MISKTDVARVGGWADAIFGDQDRFPDRDILLHLVEEVGELIRVPGDGEEMADVVLIVMHLAQRKGVDLGAALEAKFKMCQESDWHYAEDSGRVRRIK
jgi:NTP pyrophosphatase (non-canonical NTP hydrolase)